MRQYIVRWKKFYSIVVLAESEEAAINKANKMVVERAKVISSTTTK